MVQTATAEQSRLRKVVDTSAPLIENRESIMGPIFPADQFAFGDRVIPPHNNRYPTDEEKDGNLWAIQGIIEIGSDEKRLLAVNVDEEKIIAMLASARFGFLAKVYPELDILQGDEVEIISPMDAFKALYEEGANKMPQIGRVAIAA